MAVAWRASIEIRAPADRVFALICTPERLPEWNVSVERARRVDPAATVCLGARAIMTGRLLGQPLESETEVVTFEPPRLFATRAIRGPRLNTRFVVESAAFGSRVDVEVSGEVPGGALGARLAEGFLRKELSRSLDRLRALAEREAATAAAADATAEPLEGGDPACWLHLHESRNG
jgi:uncharacterized protein YndB with AHSA1/START domain